MRLLLLLTIIGFCKICLGQQIVDTCKYTVYRYPGGKISSEGHICGNFPYGYWKSYYPDGILKSEGYWMDNKLDSLWLFYFPDGSLKLKIAYKNGLKHGYEYEYYSVRNKTTDKNFMKSEVLYIDGKKQGYANIFYLNGMLFQKLKYENNLLNGTSFEYDSVGNLIALYEYRDNRLIDKEIINQFDANGLKNGIWKEFYFNNRIKSEIYYLHGKINGLAKWYNISGQLDSAFAYINNIKVIKKVENFETTDFKIEFYPYLSKSRDSIKKFSGSFIGNKPVGVHRYYDSTGIVFKSLLYDENGNLEAKGIVDDEGNKIGNWEFYYSDKSLKAEGSYRNNKRTGVWKFYFNNGKIEQIGEFKNDKFHQEWKWFYPSGKLLRTEFFNNGKADGEYIEYDENGDIIVNGKYVDGVKEGFWTQKDGQFIYEGNYINDTKNGEWIIKNYHNKIIFRGSYIQDQPVGKHFYYFENGFYQRIETYVDGRKQGIWLYYDYYGDLIKTIEFDNDECIKIDGITVNNE